MNDFLTQKASGVKSEFWAPFTSMRQFKEQQMSFVSAKGMYYQTADGRSILDAMAGLWCVNAGHGQEKITEAIKKSAEKLDYVSCFKMNHPDASLMAQKVIELCPTEMGQVFFTNSGSEAVDTALKIARAYHSTRGDSKRTKFIGRSKGYHGMGFGGLSVAGLGRQKRDFGPLLGEVTHLPLPYDGSMRFSSGQPDHGQQYAEILNELLDVQDPTTVAAVIVEPVTGSGGVYPPPAGYLDKLREICHQHGVLLIFDEVITGFGRLGNSFAAQTFNVVPDIMTIAKGMTNGAVPMGGVVVKSALFDSMISVPYGGIELMHGYTYSAHPLACAAGLATIEVHKELGINENVKAIEPHWINSALSLRKEKGVSDIRAIGLLCAVELAGRGAPGALANAVAQNCFDEGILVRASGDNILISPPLIINRAEVDRIFDTLTKAIAAKA